MQRLTRGKGLIGSIQIGSGATIKSVNNGALSVVYGTILPGRVGTATNALAGLAVGDVVITNPRSDIPNGAVYAGAAIAAGSLSPMLGNVTAGTIAPGTFTLDYAHIDLT